MADMEHLFREQEEPDVLKPHWIVRRKRNTI